MRHIYTFESEKIYIKDLPDQHTLTRAEASELESYVIQNNLEKELIVWGNNFIRLMNYVGVVQCASFTMEILPKLDLAKDARKARHTLLMMLDEVYQLHITTTRTYTFNDDPYSLFHIFAQIYTEDLLHEFKRGIHSQYRATEKNNHHLKGKLNIPKHIKHNMLKKQAHRAYCTFTEHSHNNVINQLFLATNLLVQKYIRNGDTVTQLNQLNHQLQDVDQLIFTSGMLQDIVIDRKLYRYRTAIHLAKLFQQHLTGGLTIGKQDAFSLLFDMAGLYEQYIAALIQHYLPVHVSIQDNTHALFKRRQRGLSARIYPDIVVANSDSNIIIDTKWKAYNTKDGIREDDLVQMYKYLNAYANCPYVFVLYPETETSHTGDNDVYDLLPYHDKKVIAKTIPLNNKQESIQFLDQMLHSNGSQLK